MPKALVIVESPTKARTIKRYLGSDYEVEASMGHIKDLPKNDLGVDVEHGFSLDYRVKPDKRDVVSKLKKAAQGVAHIYLAADPDREGEAIAWHVAEELKSSGAPIDRITFHEITKRAIEEAMQKPGKLNDRLYFAQMARRSMDRIVGYTMSPLLWKKVKPGLSGGRVQSVAVRLICERQAEIESFKPEEYWTIDTELKTAGGAVIPAHVVIPKEIADQAAAENVRKTIETAPAITVREVKRKLRTRNPQPPFITSTLQQAASSKLRFSAKKTMMLAQQLYEGIAIGAGGEMTGLITYMRTDSPAISVEALEHVRGYVQTNLGANYLPESPRVYQAKKNAQAAHEAIRPTDINNTPEKLAPYLSRDQLALYEMIWKRLMASQMQSATYDQTSIEIEAGAVQLRASGSVLKFDGFLKVYEEHEESEAILPDGVNAGDKLELNKIDPKQHFTQPPARYTEASLIKELEERGIGRPSTYAPTISTIVDRGYVELESRAFRPTELGRDVNSLLVANYPNIMDVGFTARMEDKLDAIEEGSTGYPDAMQEFYSTYSGEHDEATTQMENLRAAHRPSGLTCEKCGKEMLIKLGKNGHFLGCAGYPECTNTLEYTRDEAGRIIVQEQPELPEVDETCDNCGAKMVVKRGRFGSFLACSNYPSCKTTRPLEKPQVTDKICDKCGSPMQVRKGKRGPFLGCSNYPNCKNIMPLSLGFKCPKPDCDGEIVQQMSKRGKMFYACNKEGCDFVSWTKPLEGDCPDCGAKFLIKKGDKLICPNPDCGHARED